MSGTGVHQLCRGREVDSVIFSNSNIEHQEFSMYSGIVEGVVEYRQEGRILVCDVTWGVHGVCGNQRDGLRILMRQFGE